MILSIAGFDSSGGAGIQVDEMTALALNQRFLGVRTADTLQTAAQGVAGITCADPRKFEISVRNALKNYPITAIKIGMLGEAGIIHVVHDVLSSIRIPIILDPVLSASAGGLLLPESAIPVFLNTLAKKATLVTPNLPEISRLLGESVESPAEIERAGAWAIAQGMQAILIKGGHGAGQDSADYFLDRSGLGRWLSVERLPVSLRGTGCRLSTAIAAYAGIGHSLYESVRLGKHFVYNLLHAALNR